jgi:enoyl-CoA hydratase/carnithine racemase
MHREAFFMNQVSLLQLREVADQMIMLASTFQIKPHYLRAKQIRQADKSLIMVDAFFSRNLSIEAKQWLESLNGLSVLRKKLASLEEKQREIDELETRLNTLQSIIQLWCSLEEPDKQKIIQNAPVALSEAIQAVNASFDKTKNGYEAEINAFGRLFGTADFKEGTTAFLEKRKANFSGK